MQIHMTVPNLCDTVTYRQLRQAYLATIWQFQRFRILLLSSNYNSRFPLVIVDFLSEKNRYTRKSTIYANQQPLQASSVDSSKKANQSHCKDKL